MVNPAYAIPFLDSTAHLSKQYKQAALQAGHGIPFLSDEAKYAQALSDRAAQEAAAKRPQPDVK